MYKFFKILILIFLSSFVKSLHFHLKKKLKLVISSLTGDNKEIGHQIIKSTRIALKDINSKK